MNNLYKTKLSKDIIGIIYNYIISKKRAKINYDIVVKHYKKRRPFFNRIKINCSLCQNRINPKETVYISFGVKLGGNRCCENCGNEGLKTLGIYKKSNQLDIKSRSKFIDNYLNGYKPRIY